ncbi:MAG: RadC family protein [Planctomycetota bacterium]
MVQIAGEVDPQARIVQLGEPRLSDAECLTLVLRARGVRAAEAAARGLLTRFGGVVGVAGASVRELSNVPGLGVASAAAVAAAFGLARRLSEARCAPGKAIRSGADVARLVRDATRHAGREHFFSVLLDTRHRILGLRLISVGSLQTAPVHPREVFVSAIREGAAAVVVAHNHPSGDPTPSPEDRRVTERLRQVGQLCGIEVLDHVVVGHETYWSFADGLERPFSPSAGGAAVGLVEVP